MRSKQIEIPSNLASQTPNLHGHTNSFSNTSAHEVPARLYYNDEDNVVASGGFGGNNAAGDFDDAEESDSFYVNNFESAGAGG